MKLKLGVGWFSDEPFALFHLELFEQWNVGAKEFSIFSIQITKFSVSLDWRSDNFDWSSGYEK